MQAKGAPEELFQFTVADEQMDWIFELKPDNTDLLNYMAVDEERRSLRDLVLDMDSQVEAMAERWFRRNDNNERAIRKMTEKLLKYLEVHLSAFAADIEEDKKLVKDYFKKMLQNEVDRERISTKAKNWLLNTLVQLPRAQMLQVSKKYMQTYFKEAPGVEGGPRIQPNRDDYYLIYMDDGFKPHSEELYTNTENLIQIDLNLNVDDRVISQSFLWDAEMTSEPDIHVYTNYLLKDLLLEHGESVDKLTFDALHEECRTQLKAQLKYKGMLAKYKNLIANFSSMEANNQMREYNIPIEIKLMDDQGATVYSDNFEWDILNDANNVEQFGELLVRDEGLPREYLSQLCSQIRTQIHNQLNSKFMSMALLYRSVSKERDTPKLSMHATSQIRKNIIHTLDVTLPCNPEGYSSPSTVDFNNSDMFSLISRNIDLLPEEFQSAVGFTEVRKDKDTYRITPEKLDSYVRTNNVRFDNNPYLPSAVLQHFDASRLKQLYSGTIAKDL